MPARHAASVPIRPHAPGPFARMRYRLDLAISRSPLTVIGYLAAITLTVVLLAAAALTALHLTGVNGGPRLGFAEAFWQSLLRMLGKGAFASDQHWATRVLSLIVTIAGIFLAGALIGLITTAVNQRVANLRKGRSAVLERGHTLVLGWSPRLPTILAQLVLANADRRRAAFVVLAERPQDQMEDELRRQVPHCGTTRVVCRTGDPGQPADLRLVNLGAARSVIVLDDEDGDAGVVRTVLAVRSLDPDFANTHLVAEVSTEEHAETLRRLTDGRVAVVQADQVISRVTAQACHQRGLAGLFRDLLDFEGDEIHFAAAPALTGHTYREALQSYATSSVLGVCRAGTVMLNPAADFVLNDGDEIIAVASDANAVRTAGVVEPVTEPHDAGPQYAEPAQRIAMIGWSPLGIEVIRELDRVTGDGSRIDLLVDGGRYDAVPVPPLEHCTVQVHTVAPEPEALVEAVGNVPYELAIVLGYRHHVLPREADARTMLTLLALHKAWATRDPRPRVVAEMLDRADVEVAGTIGVDDFIVSDELSSLMIAQLSERGTLQTVFDELFADEGCVVSLRPAAGYAPDEAVTYASIVAAALERGETALGYRVNSDPVVLNPAKSRIVHLRRDDRVLVLGPRAPRPTKAVFPARVIAASALTS